MQKTKITKKIRKIEKIEREIKKDQKFYFLILRYLFVLISGFFIFVFYRIFIPLNVFILHKIFAPFYEVVVKGNTLIYRNVAVEIIPPCVGGSAYYLLLALNFLTPKIKPKDRVAILFYSFFVFFLFNFVRLVTLTLLELHGINTEFYHVFYWYVGSTFLVFFIWITVIKIFKIEEIPVVSDFRWIIKLIKKQN